MTGERETFFVEKKHALPVTPLPLNLTWDLRTSGYFRYSVRGKGFPALIRTNPAYYKFSWLKSVGHDDFVLAKLMHICAVVSIRLMETQENPSRDEQR